MARLKLETGLRSRKARSGMSFNVPWWLAVVLVTACSETAGPVSSSDDAMLPELDSGALDSGALFDHGSDVLVPIDAGRQFDGPADPGAPGSCGVVAQVNRSPELFWPEQGVLAIHQRRHRYVALKVSADATVLSDRCRNADVFWPPEYRWTAVGQKSQFPGSAFERFHDNGNPLNGGDRDDETTPGAFVLLPGPADVYEVWLEVVVRPWPPELGGTVDEFAAGAVISLAGPLLFETIEVGEAP